MSSKGTVTRLVVQVTASQYNAQKTVASVGFVKNHN